MVGMQARQGRGFNCAALYSPGATDVQVAYFHAPEKGATCCVSTK